MIIMKSRLKVIHIEYGKEKAELITTQIKTKYEEIQKIVLANVP